MKPTSRDNPQSATTSPRVPTMRSVIRELYGWKDPIDLLSVTPMRKNGA
jgi:hypothetical protein